MLLPELLLRLRGGLFMNPESTTDLTSVPTPLSFGSVTPPFPGWPYHSFLGLFVSFRGYVLVNGGVKLILG